MKLDPKALLSLLREAGAPPAGIDPSTWTAAKGWVVDSGAAPPEEVARLPESLAVALLESAVQARAPQLPVALAQAKGPLAKAAKHALYRLKSLGVTPPEAPVALPRGIPTPKEEDVPGLLSPVLGNGEQALVATRIASTGVTVYEVVFTDEEGLTHLSSAELARGAYRKQLKHLREDRARGNSQGVVEISAADARALLGEAAGHNLRSKRPYPQGTEAALRRLELTPRLEQEPLPPPTLDDLGRLGEGKGLHEEPEIQRWFPPEAEIRRLALALDTLATSRLQLSELQRNEQVATRIAQTVEHFFVPETRQLYARRLWRMADYFRASGRPEAEARSRSEARRLFHEVGPTRSVFALRLFEKVLALSGPTPAAPTSPSGLILSP